MSDLIKTNKYKLGIALFLLILMISLKFSNLSFMHTPHEAMAFQRAEIIAKKLIETGFKRKVFTEKVPENFRGLASVSTNANNEVISTDEVVFEGKIGRDPWGKSFSYKKINNQLYIWSGGENQKIDSSLEQIENKKKQQDDLLLVTEIRL